MPEQRLIDANKLKAHYAWWGDTEERRTLDDIVDAQPTVDAVVLPCNVGDTVWFVNWSFNSEICQAVVTRAEINLYTPQCPMWFVIEYASKFVGKQEFRSRMDLMFGKTVFLTREAAEAALAERRAD